ncbi:MAG: PAS domain S-box protein [Caldiserica bacterium]|nr:PAS domain S-box protein [Caldisericota bacterium]
MDRRKNKSINDKRELAKRSAELSIDNPKNSIEDLKEIKKDYSLLFNKMSNGFALHEIILDKEGIPCDYRFLEVNPAFEKLTGLKRADIIGKTALEVLPGLQPYLIDTYGKVAVTGKSVQFEHYSQPLDKYYEVNAYSPKKGYFVTIFSELGTESQIFKRYFEKYLEYASALFLLLDKEGCVILINKKGVELLGYPEEEIIGKDWFMKFLPEDKRIETKKYFMKILRGEVPIDSYYENPVITKSGVKTLKWQNTLLKDANRKIFGILTSAEDFTERKKMEEEVLREKALLDQLVETAPESIVLTDNQGKVLHVNSEFVHMFGYEVDEAVGQNIDDLIAPPGLQEEARTITESILQGERVSLESVRRKKDNTLLNVSIIGSPVQIAGKQEAVYAIYRDITERKRAEEILKNIIEQLKESARKWNITFDTIGDGVVLMDAEQNIRQCNKAFADFLGKPFSEIVGRKCYRLVHGNDCPVEDCPFIKTKQSKQRESMELRLKDHFFNALVDPILDENNNIIGAVHIVTDITERKRAEEALQRNEEKFKTLIETTDTGFHILDAQGRVIDANKEFIRITGYDTLEEILGRSVSEWTAPHDRERSATEVKKCIKQGYVKNLEIDYVNRIGQITPIEINASVIGSGDSAKIFSLCRDITERKRTEEALKNSNEQLKKLFSFQNIIRELNQFLLKCDNEDEIYKKVCDIIMESDIIKFVWIGLTEEGTFDVKPAAYAGIEKGYINSIKAKWDNSQYGKGPTGTAIKTQKPVVIGDIKTDPTYMPWREEALKRGFFSLISLPIIHEGKVIGVLDIYSDKKDAFIEEDIELFKEVAGDIAIGIKSIRLEKNLQKKSKQLEKSVENIIFTMVKMSESKDLYTAGHQKKVSQLATAIARKMGLSEDRIEALRFASLIHDIGKFTIPGEILTKPSKLSETEFALIKEHPETGYNIIKDVDFPWEIASIILQHHERLDGSGYHEGLKDKEILLESKILAVADVVEAMSSHRPYRVALGIDKALEEISMNKGKLYDPGAVEACIKLFKEDGFKFE